MAFFFAGGSAVEREAELIEEKFLKNQALLGLENDRHERVDRFSRRRKVVCAMAWAAKRKSRRTRKFFG